MQEDLSYQHVLQYARQKALHLGEDRAEDFSILIHFLLRNEEFAPNLRTKNKPQLGSEEWVDTLVVKYEKGLKPEDIPIPKTIPDPALGVVLSTGYGVDHSIVEEVVEGHRYAMVAENIVGNLLERYIASSLEKGDWVWAAGAIVKAVDFVRKSPNPDLEWEALQVKNRSNSENSSSAAIRSGTNIEKWHRTVATTGKTLWDNFPVGQPGGNLNEEDFQSFIREFIEKATAPTNYPNLLRRIQ